MENEYYFVNQMKTILKETSNFKIIELSGGPYPTWEQIALPNAAKKNMAVTYCIVLVILLLFSSIPLITILHDIIYMESSYLKILTSSASTYQNLETYIENFSALVVKKGYYCVTLEKTELRILK
jgi:hypothetical protein